MAEMDAIDAKQQEEINRLKVDAQQNTVIDLAQADSIAKLHIKDERHDTLLFMTNAILVFLVLTTFVNWFLIFYMMTKIKP
jgi:hypothetical protein